MPFARRLGIVIVAVSLALAQGWLSVPSTLPVILAPATPDRALVIYESGDYNVPSYVLRAVRELNTAHDVLAMVIDDDVTTGTGGVPAIAARAIEAARARGLPSLVVLRNGEPEAHALPVDAAGILRTVGVTR